MYVVIFTLLVVGLGVLIAAADCLDAWWEQRQRAQPHALDSRQAQRKRRAVASGGRPELSISTAHQ
jgi:hypothetical protein